MDRLVSSYRAVGGDRTMQSDQSNSPMRIDKAQWGRVLTEIARIRARRRISMMIIVLSLFVAAIVGQRVPSVSPAFPFIWLITTGIVGVWWHKRSRCPRCNENVYASVATVGFRNHLTRRCVSCGISLNPRIAAQQLREASDEERPGIPS